jgi:AcrR family transcriptional regulator
VKQAALACLMDKGYDNLSVRAVAARAGVSTGVLYHYFRNKDDILIQSLATAFAGTNQALRDAVEQQQGEARLLAYLAHASTLGSQDPTTVQVLLNGLGQVPYAPAIRERLGRLFASFREYAGGVLAGSAGSAGLPPDRQEALAALIVAIGLGLSIQWATDPESVSPERCGEALRQLFTLYAKGGTADV